MILSSTHRAEPIKASFELAASVALGLGQFLREYVCVCVRVCVSLFVCWVNKTRAVNLPRRFHSWRLIFTQDGPVFSVCVCCVRACVCAHNEPG